MYYSFFLTPGKWYTNGAYIGPKNQIANLDGTTTITQFENRSHISEVFEANTLVPLSFTTDYEIYTSVEKQNIIYWTSCDQSFGRIFGKFIYSNDKIICMYENEKNHYSMIEIVKPLNQYLYICEGIVYEGKQIAYSWNLLLRKEQPPICNWFIE
jgi:hypothetical protein